VIRAAIGSAEAAGADAPALAGACEAAVELAGVGVAALLQAEATIAKTANGAAMRNVVFLVVKVRSPST
jgi:hypothetical protein